MGFSVGGSPQGVPENQTTTTTTTTGMPGATTQAEGTVTVKQPVPSVEQGLIDQISQMTDTSVKPFFSYAASAQVPVLPKPVEEKKEEKKAEKEKQTHTGDNQTVDSPQNDIQADGEQKSHKEQEEGQSGGQSGGGSESGSGGSNNGSFSGGQSDQSSKGNTSTGVANSNEVSETKGTTNVNATSGEKTETVDNKKAGSVDPLKDPTPVTPSGLFSPPVNPAQFFDNSHKIMNEIYLANVKFAETMPDGPDKFRFTDFLKLVQEALIGFQELLRAIQSSDSKGGTDRSKAKLEATLAKIEVQKEEQEEIYKKQAEAAHKMQVMAPLMAFFAFLMVVLLAVILAFAFVLLVASGPAGWMAIAMLVCELVDQGAKLGGQKPFMMEKFVGALTEVSNAIVDSCAQTFNLSPQQVEEGKAIAKTVTVSLTMAVVLYANPAVFIFGGVMALLSFLNESHIVRDMEIRRGASEVDAAKAEMYAQLAIGVSFAIAAMAVAFIMPPSMMASVGTLVASASEKLAKYSLIVAKQIGHVLKLMLNTADAATQKIVKTIQAMIQVAFDPEIWVSVTSLGLQTTSAVMTYQYENLMAEIALIQGQMDSEIELKETTIAILKKMIQQLLDGLQGTGQQISDIGQLLKKTHSDVSQISSSLFG